MIRQAKTMFSIVSIEDYLAFCAEAVARFERRQDDVLPAFAAILALNHISDWLQYKLTETQRMTLGLTSSRVGDCVKEYFESKNDDLKRVREIANGFKHLKPGPSTAVVAGYGHGPYGVGPVGTPYLQIDLGEGLPLNERWDVAFSLCERTLRWWRIQLLEVIGAHKDSDRPSP